MDELGALIEGTLKLFLSVYYNDFQADVESLKAAGAFDHKAQSSKSPDGLTARTAAKVCGGARPHRGERRCACEARSGAANAIHAFKDRPIGDGAEFWGAVRDYLAMLGDVEDRLPYP